MTGPHAWSSFSEDAESAGEWLRRLWTGIPEGSQPALARQLLDAQKFLLAGISEEDPDRAYMNALGPAFSLMEDIRSGRWSTRHDQTLADIRRAVLEPERALDDPSATAMRLIVAVLCADRLVHRAGRPAVDDPPELPEIDAASADLAAALAAFERDPAPFPAELFSGGARVRLSQLLALRGAVAAGRLPKRSRPRPEEDPREDEQTTVPASAEPLPATGGFGDLPDYPIPSRSALDGMRFVLNSLPDGDPLRHELQILLTMGELGPAALSGQAAEVDRIAAELEGLSGDAQDSGYRRLIRSALTITRCLRCVMKMESPRPEERPDPAEITAALDELESVTGELPDVPEISDSIGAMVSDLRSRLSASPSRADMNSRAGGKDAGPDDSRSSRSSFLPPVPGERDFSALFAEAHRAAMSGNPADLNTAIDNVGAVSRELPAGHPAHSSVLTLLAELLSQRADRTGSRDDIQAATDTAISAVRSASSSGVREPAYVLYQLLGKMTTRGHAVGPFEAAESALAQVLAKAPADDIRMIAHLGIGGARLASGTATGDTAALRSALEEFRIAETFLGEPQPRMEWFGPALQLMAWILNCVMRGQADAAAVAMASRLADQTEDLLVRHPEFAEEMTSRFPSGPLPFPADGGSPPALQAIRAMREMLTMFSGDNMIARMFRGNPHAMFAAQMQAGQAPFSPPAPLETRRLARRGLDIAYDALRRDQQDAEVLHVACNDLTAALAGGLDDDALRHEVNLTLGICLARRHWLGEADPVIGPPGVSTLLGGAIRHLELALAGSEHSLPDLRRAGQHDLLARCYRQSELRGERADGTRQAELAAHAALRELARCVLVAANTADGLRIAGRANDIVARSIGWCLEDNRTDAAVAFAEAGRGLVLASSVVSGRVTEILEGAGEHDAARAWAEGSQEGRLAGLGAVWRTPFGNSLLRTPGAAEVTTMMRLLTDADAIVYLVPPDDGLAGAGRHDGDLPAGSWPLRDSGNSVARALVCHSGTDARIDELSLPGLGSGPSTPLHAYLDEFGTALTGSDPVAWDPGVPDSPHYLGSAAPNRAWLGTLEKLGAWAYENIMGPLIGKSEEWGINRIPHVVLVPLGALAAIPFAAAWTADPGLPGGRRYAIHDLAISYAASGRLLSEVARRPRRNLTDRVVLSSTGNFPFGRAAITALAHHLYPHAEVYGLRNAPDGAASTDSLLTALVSGAGRPAASLLHLSAHGTSEPVARLRTTDGWLELNTILRQAQTRKDIGGGLVVTNACLTDTTRRHYDESVTLATALLTAGATGVVGTRWPVHEDTSAAFSYHLHHHLVHGHAAAQALRLAQLDMLAASPPRRAGQPAFMAAIDHERRTHPASWAGYTYHGS